MPSLRRPPTWSRRAAPIRMGRVGVLASLIVLAAVPVSAQDVVPPGPVPPAEIPNVDIPPPLLPPGFEPSEAGPGSGLPGGTGGLPAAVSPFAPSDVMPEIESLDLAPVVGTEVLVSARLADGGPALEGGLVWRLFGGAPGPDGKLPLVGEAEGGSASFRVKPGVYFLHCGFGHAGTTERVEVTSGLIQKDVVLNAGGLILQATADGDRPLPRELVWFDVYSLDLDERGERKVVARDVKPGDLVRLPANTYYVVNRYGAVNAMTRADVEVKAGKLAEVTLTQRAAEVTLKLVGAPGGEAIADTHWSILTPGGDEVAEGVGAFPSFVLAAGEYTVVAKHDEAVFQRDFEVESGTDDEVEVLAANPVRTPAAP